MIRLFILIMLAVSAQAQYARPTYNPFSNNGGITPYYGQNQMMSQQGYYNQQRSNNNMFQNFQNGFQRPNNNMFQNNSQNFQNGFQRPNNNMFQNNQNGFQQQGNGQANANPLFTRRYHLNNGYLFGRPTLYYDPKSNKMQPWVRKNLR